jgi:hypothetical protein
MRTTQMNRNLRDYLQVKEAAEILGVSPSTLRNWERAGKITAYHNPINDFTGCSASRISRSSLLIPSAQPYE